MREEDIIKIEYDLWCLESSLQSVIGFIDNSRMEEEYRKDVKHEMDRVFETYGQRIKDLAWMNTISF